MSIALYWLLVHKQEFSSHNNAVICNMNVRPFQYLLYGSMVQDGKVHATHTITVKALLYNWSESFATCIFRTETANLIRKSDVSVTIQFRRYRRKDEYPSRRIHTIPYT